MGISEIFPQYVLREKVDEYAWRAMVDQYIQIILKIGTLAALVEAIKETSKEANTIRTKMYGMYEDEDVTHEDQDKLRKWCDEGI